MRNVLITMRNVFIYYLSRYINKPKTVFHKLSWIKCHSSPSKKQ